EPQVRIERELAAVLARTEEGEVADYPVAETVQRDGICREILAPAPVPEALRVEAARLARDIAEAIGATGILAVELFLTRGGLLVNELALRPHNSGHFTIEGCATSQFEQHLRAVLGWPLGSTRLRAPAVATVNVLGAADATDPRSRVPAALAAGSAHLHLYGKEPRPGRKLGHVTVLGEDLDPARAEARRVAALLEGGAS
ncbi:MAG: ATP-grasp domain-containing protein, partial [Syntrophothermus sp.]